MTFETLVYTSDGPIATITLNRPNELNTIVPPMPDEFETAINLAVKDASIKVIILRGAGRSFCAGYDFGGGFHLWDEQLRPAAHGMRERLCLGDSAGGGADAKVHEHVARAKTSHCAGARLVRRRRQ